MTRIALASVLAVFALAAVPAAASYNNRIVPGVRIGKVLLGQDVPASFGQPTHSDGAAGHLWSTWKGATGNTLDVYGEIGGTGHLTQLVRVTSSWFRTSSGVHTGQTWGHVKAYYPGTLVSTYDSHQFSRKLAFMDNKSKGIAFEVTLNAANHVTNSSKVLAVWVHKKGVAFDPSSWVIYEPGRP